jgi:hypothetical protein
VNTDTFGRRLTVAIALLAGFCLGCEWRDFTAKAELAKCQGAKR